MIVFQKVTKMFGRVPVLTDVSFRIDPGEFVCIASPSGGGKTTIVSLIIGAEMPTKGSVEIDGVELKRLPSPALQLYRRRVGVVFQDQKLLPQRTVAENIAFPLEVCGIPDTVIGRRVADVIAQMELGTHADAFPHQLSAGERARVALGRAIVHKPLIILADEPTGNADPEHAVAIVHLLKDMQSTGTTIILCTNDGPLVDTLQTRVIRLKDGSVGRDSFGGYDQAKRTQPKAPVPHAEHRFFADTPGVPRPPVPAPAAPSPQEREWKKEPPKPGNRKVKITSIGSE